MAVNDNLPDFIRSVSNFDTLAPREKIKLFGWFLHTHQNVETFGNDHIRKCFRQLHLEPPNVAIYLSRMANYKPPDLLKVRGCYQLARSIRSSLDTRFGALLPSVAVGKLLTQLPGQIPRVAQKVFLEEAIKCYRVGAYRACIVMTWNLAFDHLSHWILDDNKRTDAFNDALIKRFPKKNLLVRAVNDLEELREFDVIEICRSSNILSKNIIDILRTKLSRRNAAAHPSSVILTQAQADDAITDLVNNVVLTLR